MYIFAIDYKLKLSSLKLMVIWTGGEVFGIGNSVAGVGGGGGEEILISRVKNLAIPSGARMADL